MRLLVAQPNHEPHLEHLLKEMSRQDSFDAVLYPEGYVADEVSVKTLCELAKTYKKLIITGYRNSNNKDRALMIHPSGISFWNERNHRWMNSCIALQLRKRIVSVLVICCVLSCCRDT